MKEFDIALGVTPEELQRAYLELWQVNPVPDSGMIELTNLMDYLRAEQSSPDEEFADALEGQAKGIDALIGGDLLQKMASQPLVTLTDNPDAVKTGSIKIDVSPNGRYDVFRYGDQKDENINFQNEMPLTFENNPTNWRSLTLAKLP